MGSCERETFVLGGGGLQKNGGTEIANVSRLSFFLFWILLEVCNLSSVHRTYDINHRLVYFVV